MNKPAVHADRVAQEQRQVGKSQAEKDRRNGIRQWSTNQRDQQVSVEPQRLRGRPDHSTMNRVRAACVDSEDARSHGTFSILSSRSSLDNKAIVIVLSFQSPADFRHVFIG